MSPTERRHDGEKAWTLSVRLVQLSPEIVPAIGKPGSGTCKTWVCAARQQRFCSIDGCAIPPFWEAIAGVRLVAQRTTAAAVIEPKLTRLAYIPGMFRCGFITPITRKKRKSFGTRKFF